MKNLSVLVCVALTLVLAACATVKPPLDNHIACASKSECDQDWQRLQVYVAKHSHFRIQITNDVLLQTFGPSDDPFFAYSLTRENNADGSATLTIDLACGNLFGCQKSKSEELEGIKNFVNSAH